jgi:hypothetical protein
MSVLTPDRAKQLRNDETFKMYLTEIDLRIRNIQEKMINCKPEDLLGYQKNIQGLKTAAAIPEEVIDANE